MFAHNPTLPETSKQPYVKGYNVKPKQHAAGLGLNWQIMLE